MPTAPLTSPAKPKTNQDKQVHARNVIRQILNEPVEIAKTATKQVTGEWRQQATVQEPRTGEQPAFGNRQEHLAKQKRDARHYQAFQNELQEIRRIQKQRDQERRELRMQEEQQKQAQAEQVKKKEQEGLIEPVSRKARGLWGGAGAMLGVKRKQRGVELAKTPSN